MPRFNAQFEGSAATLGQCPNDDLPEVALVGRSNSGKSSTLNRLSGQNNLARVSKTPGRTRLINLFSTNYGLRLVDLPGYGYAKASRKEQERWNAMVNDYLANRDNLVGLIVIADVRHDLKESDLAMLDWSERREISTLLLLNKSDKLKRGAQNESLRQCQNQLTAYPAVGLTLFSANQGTGVDDVLSWLERLVQ